MSDFQNYLDYVNQSVDAAQRDTGISLSVATQQIVTSWIVAIPYEAPSGELVDEALPFGGTEAASLLINELPRLLLDIAESESLQSREPPFQPNLVTSIDLFHWLVSRGGRQLAFLPCPYEKDEM
jgi:hypothetical protein